MRAILDVRLSRRQPGAFARIAMGLLLLAALVPVAVLKAQISAAPERRANDGSSGGADPASMTRTIDASQMSPAVLLVTDGNYFLEKAITGLELKNSEIIRPAVYEELTPQKRDKYNVFIFDRYNPRKLSSHGNSIFFLDGKNAALPNDSKIKIARDARGSVAMFEDEDVRDWKRDHPILKGLALGKMHVAEAVKLQLPRDAQVLIDGTNGPLLAMDRQDRTTNLVVAFDSLQSNWPLQVSFPMFLQNALQFLVAGDDTGARESRAAAEPGSPVLGEGPTCSFDATLYSVRLPVQRITKLDVRALESAAQTPESFEKALAALGTAKPTYRASQMVRLAGDTIKIGSRTPYVNASMVTGDGRTIDTFNYINTGATFALAGNAGASAAVNLDLNIEVSAVSDSDVSIVTGGDQAKRFQPIVHTFNLMHKGLVRPRQPFVVISVDASSLDKDGNAAAFIGIVKVGDPQPPSAQ